MVASILCFGSSQGEVLDYVFHGDPRYITPAQDDRAGYCGGASGRGLKKESNRKKILGAVANQLSRDDIDAVVVFLVYGSVDIDWTIPYKKSLGQEPDSEVFIEELASSVMALVRDLLALENAPDRLTLVLTYPYAPVPLSKKMMFNEPQYVEDGPYDMTSRAERHEMWMSYIRSMKQHVQLCSSKSLLVADATPAFEAKVTDAEYAEAFMKDKTGRDGGWNGWTDNWLEDNHPDFIKTQGIVAECIAALQIPDVAPKPTLTELYPCARRWQTDENGQIVVAENDD